MTIHLPLPSPRLSPNGSRGHWSATAKARKQARQLARLATLSALRGGPPPEVTRYHLRFFHKVRRRRDDDNAIATTKAYRDGIADALGIDDHRLRIARAPAMAIDRDLPRLEIDLLP